MLVTHDGSRPKGFKSTPAALFFTKFRIFSGEYLGNCWADFGSVSCVGNVGKVFSRKVLSDFLSDLK